MIRLVSKCRHGGEYRFVVPDIYSGPLDHVVKIYYGFEEKTWPLTYISMKAWQEDAAGIIYKIFEVYDSKIYESYFHKLAQGEADNEDLP